MTVQAKKRRHPRDRKLDVVCMNMDGGGVVKFPLGLPYTHRNKGWATTVGEIRLADGTEYDALIELCVEDQGEHWGTYVVVGTDVAYQGEDDFFELLGKTKKEVFPYKYRYYDEALRAGDIHVDPETGWSRH